MTASAAARRNGVDATGPPSWKTSSTMITRLRSCTSGMRVRPSKEFELCLKFRNGRPRKTIRGANNALQKDIATRTRRRCGCRRQYADAFLETKRRGIDQAFFLKQGCDPQ